MKRILPALVLALALATYAFAQHASPTPAATPAATPARTPAPPQAPEDFFNRAVDDFRRGDLVGAEREVRTAIALDSHYVDAQYLLGQVLLYRAAQRNRLLIENPGIGSASLPAEGEWHEDIDDLQEAISQFRIVIRLQPSNTSAWLLLATCLGNLGQTDDAISAYKQTINLDPTAPTARDAWNNLGLVYLHKKRYAEAKKAFDEALRIDPTFMPARVNLEKLKKLKPGLFR
jgi:tetratricopeptide (TPR) repeat protein